MALLDVIYVHLTQTAAPPALKVTANNDDIVADQIAIDKVSRLITEFYNENVSDIFQSGLFVGEKMMIVAFENFSKVICDNFTETTEYNNFVELESEIDKIVLVIELFLKTYSLSTESKLSLLQNMIRVSDMVRLLFDLNSRRRRLSFWIDYFQLSFYLK